MFVGINDFDMGQDNKPVALGGWFDNSRDLTDTFNGQVPHPQMWELGNGDDTSGQIAALEKQIEQCEIQIERITGVIEELKGQQTQLKAQVAQDAQEQRGLQDQINRARIRITNLRVQIQQLTDSMSGISDEEELDKILEMINQIVIQIQQDEYEIQDFTLQIQQLTEHIKELNKKVKELDTQIATQRKQQDVLRTKIRTLNANIVRLKVGLRCGDLVDHPQMPERPKATKQGYQGRRAWDIMIQTYMDGVATHIFDTREKCGMGNTLDGSTNAQNAKTTAGTTNPKRNVSVRKEAKVLVGGKKEAQFRPSPAKEWDRKTVSFDIDSRTYSDKMGRKAFAANQLAPQERTDLSKEINDGARNDYWERVGGRDDKLTEMNSEFLELSKNSLGNPPERTKTNIPLPIGPPPLADLPEIPKVPVPPTPGDFPEWAPLVEQKITELMKANGLNENTDPVPDWIKQEAIEYADGKLAEISQDYYDQSNQYREDADVYNNAVQEWGRLQSDNETALRRWIPTMLEWERMMGYVNDTTSSTRAQSRTFTTGDPTRQETLWSKKEKFDSEWRDKLSKAVEDTSNEEWVTQFMSQWKD